MYAVSCSKTAEGG
jgi:hypothetical protein